MPERPPRADARRNREKVLRAAAEAFAASGYDVPLDEIAARAGVGAGTVYRHFPTKETLFEAVITARVTDLVLDARERAGAADPGVAFFGLLARVGDEATVKRDLPEAIAVPGPLQEELHVALGVLLRRAQRAGAVRCDIDTSDLIAIFKAAAAGLRDAPGDPARRKLLFDVMTDGLRPRALGPDLGPGSGPGSGSGSGSG